jgi:hypothetical protein
MQKFLFKGRQRWHAEVPLAAHKGAAMLIGVIEVDRNEPQRRYVAPVNKHREASCSSGITTSAASISVRRSEMSCGNSMRSRNRRPKASSNLLDQLDARVREATRERLCTSVEQTLAAMARADGRNTGNPAGAGEP